MCKMAEQVMTSDEMRIKSSDWNLACDVQLRLRLEKTAAKFQQKAQDINQAIQDLDSKTTITAAKLGNVTNKLLLLSNVQFIESRVYEDDLMVHQDDKVQEQQQPKNEQEILNDIGSALSAGANFILNAFEKIELEASDDDEEEEDLGTTLEPIYESRSIYESRKLPHVIGTQTFLSDEFIGLDFEEENQDEISSESSSESEEEEDPEQVEEVPEGSNPVLNRNMDDEESDFSNPDEIQPEKVEESAAVSQSGSNFLSELSSKIGGGAKEKRAIKSKESKQKKSMFDSDSDDDDLFSSGKTRKATIIPPSKVDIIQQKKNVLDDVSDISSDDDDKGKKNVQLTKGSLFEDSTDDGSQDEMDSLFSRKPPSLISTQKDPSKSLKTRTTNAIESNSSEQESKDRNEDMLAGLANNQVVKAKSVNANVFPSVQKDKNHVDFNDTKSKMKEVKEKEKSKQAEKMVPEVKQDHDDKGKKYVQLTKSSLFEDSTDDGSQDEMDSLFSRKPPSLISTQKDPSGSPKTKATKGKESNSSEPESEDQNEDMLDGLAKNQFIRAKSAIANVFSSVKKEQKQDSFSDEKSKIKEIKETEKSTQVEAEKTNMDFDLPSSPATPLLVSPTKTRAKIQGQRRPPSKANIRAKKILESDQPDDGAKDEVTEIKPTKSATKMMHAGNALLINELKFKLNKTEDEKESQEVDTAGAAAGFDVNEEEDEMKNNKPTLASTSITAAEKVSSLEFKTKKKNSSSESDEEDLFVNTKIKSKNEPKNLFSDDSSDEEDLFKPKKTAVVTTKQVPKTNLFDDDSSDSDDDLFKLAK